MKKIVLLVIMFSLCNKSFSQEVKNNPSYALTFGIADNFRLNNFFMDIGVKKIYEDSHQFRIFLSPRISNSNYDDHTDGSTLDQHQERKNYSFGIAGDYLWEIMSEDDMKMFSGTGLSGTYGYNYYKSTSSPTSGVQDVYENVYPYTYMGIRGILGVEWMVSKHIGIHSEYLLAGNYYWEKDEIKNTIGGSILPTVTRTQSKINLSSSVLFGLSIYL